MSDSDQKNINLTVLIQSLNLPKDKLETTLAVLILMRFNQDEKQAVNFISNLTKEWSGVE